jgi:hypothetical protein
MAIGKFFKDQLGTNFAPRAEAPAVDTHQLKQGANFSVGAKMR